MRMLMLAIAVVLPAAAVAQVDDSGGDIHSAPTEQKLGRFYVCTATNTVRTQQCTATCPSRETADCEDADGSGVPTCRCTTAQ